MKKKWVSLFTLIIFTAMILFGQRDMNTIYAASSDLSSKIVMTLDRGSSEFSEKTKVSIDDNGTKDGTKVQAVLFDKKNNKVVCDLNGKEISTETSFKNGQVLANLAIPKGTVQGDYIVKVLANGKELGNKNFKIFKDNKSLIKDAVDKTVNYYKKQTQENQGMINDWEAIALRWTGQDLQSNDWMVNGKGFGYWKNEDITSENWGYGTKEHTRTTDLERITLGILGGGYDPRNFKGHNITAMLIKTIGPSGNFSPEWVNIKDDGIQGNTQVWGIIALDASHATKKEGYDAAKCIKEVLTFQCNDGGFNWMGDPESVGDVDMTGMFLTAIGPHKDIPGVQDAINKGVKFLKKKQFAHGGFGGWGIQRTINPESTVTVIQGLMACDINPLSKEWEKEEGNMLSALLQAQMPCGGFVHVIGMEELPNGMATQQALLALSDLYVGKSMYVNILTENLKTNDVKKSGSTNTRSTNSTKTKK